LAIERSAGLINRYKGVLGLGMWNDNTYSYISAAKALGTVSRKTFSLGITSYIGFIDFGAWDVTAITGGNANTIAWLPVPLPEFREWYVNALQAVSVG
jgi:hypothetical protein